jgi:hypothetical protein
MFNKTADGGKDIAGVVHEGKNFALNYGIATSKERLILLLIILLSLTKAKRELKANGKKTTTKSKIEGLRVVVQVLKSQVMPIQVYFVTL